MIVSRTTHRNRQYFGMMERIAVLLVFLSLGVSPVDAATEFVDAVTAIHSADGKAAQKILEPLAKNGDVRALSLLGTLFLDGVFLEKNVPRAKELLDRAANGGDPHAKYQVYGLLGSEDEIRGLSLELVKQYLREAANAGHPRAQYSLGVGLLVGEPFEKNIREARHWNSRAAKNGEWLVNETNFVFRFPSYLSGKVPEDSSQFIEILKASANDGAMTPGFVLGSFYLSGTGVPRDPRKALKWFAIASYSGHKDSAKYVKELSSLLGPKDKFSDPWFVNHSRDNNSAYGKAAAWCVDKKSSELKCLRNALAQHDNCLPPFFPGYFDHFLSSAGYSYCREKFLLEDSIE